VPVAAGSVSAVVVAAYKRWLLCHMLAAPAETQHACGRAGGLGAVSTWATASSSAASWQGEAAAPVGGAPALPRWVAPSMAKALESHAAPYVALARCFHTHATSSALPASALASGVSTSSASGHVGVASEHASSAAGLFSAAPDAASSHPGASRVAISSSSSSSGGGGGGVGGDAAAPPASNDGALAAAVVRGAATWAADGTQPLVEHVLGAGHAQRVARLSLVYTTLPLALAARTLGVDAAEAATMLQEMVRASVACVHLHVVLCVALQPLLMTSVPAMTACRLLTHSTPPPPLLL